MRYRTRLTKIKMAKMTKLLLRGGLGQQKQPLTRDRVKLQKDQNLQVHSISDLTIKEKLEDRQPQTLKL